MGCKSNCLSTANDRYLKECNGYASCSYYDYAGDSGQRVSELCNYAKVDSIVDLNETHDIKCPIGPVSESRISNRDINIYSMECENINIVEEVIIYEGNPVIMKFLVCLD